jgi:hypothetical protein
MSKSESVPLPPHLLQITLLQLELPGYVLVVMTIAKDQCLLYIVALYSLFVRSFIRSFVRSFIYLLVERQYCLPYTLPKSFLLVLHN